LILDCCVDIILFLINNPDSSVAIHCKAGKGRTGVMICCYLIFSGLCKSAEDAMDHYSVRRTYNKKVKKALIIGSHNSKSEEVYTIF